jgi:hypothetical protein
MATDCRLPHESKEFSNLRLSEEAFVSARERLLGMRRPVIYGKAVLMCFQFNIRLNARPPFTRVQI